MSTIRDEFEAHIVSQGYNGEHWLQRWRVGDATNRERYIKGWVQTAWEAYQAATERAAKQCEDRATAYRTTRAPGWHEVDHECTQCAAAIRAKGGEAK